MQSPPRSILDDLVTEYTLHGDRKHIYVEGPEDRAVLSWYIEPVANGKVNIIEIENVEITAEALIHHGLNGGNKNRVIVLARELSESLPEESTQVLCVVDADFDYVLKRVEVNRFLAYTDGTSLDMYAFSETVLERVIRLGMRDASSNPGQILTTLYHVLKDVFVTRAANEFLNLGLEWLPFEKQCRIQTDGEIIFDNDQFIRKYLSKNNELNKMGEFSKCRLELSNQNLGMRERWVRGHDFGNLLTRYLRKTNRTTIAREITRGKTVIRMLFVGLDRDELQATPLFRRISEFLAKGI